METRTCKCAICSIQKDLGISLQSSPNQQEFEELKDRFPRLAGFRSALDLITHLQRRNPDKKHSECVDGILTCLIQAQSSGFNQGLVADVLLVAFTPALHRLYWEICALFQGLSAEDVAQQVLTTFLEVIRSASLQHQKGYLPIAIARTVRKAAFRWAIREASKSSQYDPLDTVPPDASALTVDGDFEGSIILDDFLRRSCGPKQDYELLVKLKLEGYRAKESAELSGDISAAAVRHRLQRTLARLRKVGRETGGPNRVAKKPPLRR